MEKYLNLAEGVVREGLPFMAGERYGFQKGCMAVQMQDGKIVLVCGNLLPIDLEAHGQEILASRGIESAFSELKTAWFGMQ